MIYYNIKDQFFNNIPSSITNFNIASDKVNNGYCNCIKTADIQAANLKQVFKAKSVDEDNDTRTELLYLHYFLWKNRTILHNEILQ